MKPFKFLEPLFRRTKRPEHLAHMTFGANSSISRTLSRTGLFLKKRVWIWPILATVILSLVAYLVRSAIQSTMKANLRSQLQTLLDVEVGMLKNWLHVQKSNASALANNQAIRESIYQILEASEKNAKQATATTIEDLNLKLGKQLSPAMSAHEYADFFVANKAKAIVGASTELLIGMKNVAEYDEFISKALKGEPTICAPFPSGIPLQDETSQSRTGTPVMFICVPVRDASFDIVAVLAFRMRPDQELTDIMQLGRLGVSGETYGFDKSGLMITNSRFDDQLILAGLLADQPDSRSILNVQVRDPQGNLTAGFRPKVRRSALPLTKMAEDAVSGNSGVNVDGYRDYRGVPVIGAWTWLPTYEIGVATEIDVDEAYGPLFILQWTFWAVFVLLALTSIAIFVFTLLVTKMRREAQKASISARQLGQYTLDAKLGAGAMGVVYKGHHAMLRRATAIKLLDVDKVNDASIRRFEREVQITCQLNHPNTVAIYDYGRTPEGVFYYAMEYLDGINLQTLVEQYGPQPEGRVIRILLQLCGSLFEAHSLGLVHRDIKPANLMLNRRGCETDVLKVLDFGLVKAADENLQANMTSAGALLGTPLYMAPEAILSPNTVDGRSDLYAVGAVGYYLLTGQTVFSARGIVELCHQHVDDIPVPPSQRMGKPVSPELETAILGCLEKQRTKRPTTARDLTQMLLRCPTLNQWTTDDADAWWGRHDRGHGVNTSMTSAGNSLTPKAAASPYERTMVPTGEDDD